MKRRALVTGGAGLIGSHLVDLLLAEGWTVRILDSLEPQTHAGRPAWLPPEAGFQLGDIRDREAVRLALTDIDVVFHLAAFGGYMPEMAKFVEVNSLGTAQLLEVIRNDRLPIRKVVVASSQAVYREGAVRCPAHGIQHPPARGDDQLRRGDFSVHCPVCGGSTESVATAENAPLGGDTVYAITKIDQERLVLAWSRQTGIPAVALRYSCTYGPRQSLRNPYTGVISIFTTRLMNGLAPIIYEDGGQTRDMCYVADVARANLLAATSDSCDGMAVNIGSGVGTPVARLARVIGDRLGLGQEPEMSGEYRPGEMRDLVADVSRAARLGFRPEVDIVTGISRYLEWLQGQGNVKEYFEAARPLLAERGVVRTTRHPSQPSSPISGTAPSRPL